MHCKMAELEYELVKCCRKHIGSSSRKTLITYCLQVLVVSHFLSTWSWCWIIFFNLHFFEVKHINLGGLLQMSQISIWQCILWSYVGFIEFPFCVFNKKFRRQEVFFSLRIWKINFKNPIVPGKQTLEKKFSNEYYLSFTFPWNQNAPYSEFYRKPSDWKF